MGSPESRLKRLQGNYVECVKDQANVARHAYTLANYSSVKGKSEEWQTNAEAQHTVSAAITGPASKSILNQKMSAFFELEKQGEKKRKGIYINLRYHAANTNIPGIMGLAGELNSGLKETIGHIKNYNDNVKLFEEMNEANEKGKKNITCVMAAVPFGSSQSATRRFLPIDIKNLMPVFRTAIDDYRRDTNTDFRRKPSDNKQPSKSESELSKSFKDLKRAERNYNELDRFRKLSETGQLTYPDRLKVIKLVHAIKSDLSDYVDIVIDEGCAQAKDRAPVVVLTLMNDKRLVSKHAMLLNANKDNIQNILHNLKISYQRERYE
jgi:hypothetical protein